MFEAPSEYMKRLQNLGGDGGKNGGNGRRTPDIGSTSTKSKRMSLLPQFSRKVSGEETEGATKIQEDTSESDTASVTDQASRDSKAMPPPPRPRPTSMRPPSQIATGRSAGEHARTASTEAGHFKTPSKEGALSKTVSNHGIHAAKTSKEGSGVPARTSSHQRIGATAPSTAAASSGLKRAGSTRLPQSPGIPGPRTSSQQATGIRGSAPPTATLSSSTLQKRSSVSKPPQLSTTSKVTTKMQPSPPSPVRPTSSRTQLSASSKPAFNTYQQHYSPAKSTLPKPGLPAPKSSRPATSGGESEESEFVDLGTALEQIELLQLSLLHQNSAQTQRVYELSARQRLKKYHTRLVKDYEAVHAHEREQRQITNLTALETWCPEPSLLAEHLQTLSRIVSELRSQLEKGSRYSEVVETFETWATGAEDVLLHPDTGSSSKSPFVESLPESWRAMHTSLALKLRSTHRDIQMLPPLPLRDNAAMEASSLEVMVTNCETLVEGMLKELEVMTKLQKEVASLGKARIDERITGLMSEGSNAGEGDKENWIPAWTRVD